MSFRVARLVALRSPHPNHRHATIVMRGGAIVATGYNHDGRHAEIVALSKLWPSKRRGTTLINLRLTAGGRVGLARPCRKCQAFMDANGVRSARWTV